MTGRYANAQPHPDGYDGQVDASDTPALDLLLHRGWAEDWRVTGEVPIFCTECPFSSRSIEPYTDISNDTTEAHYRCSLKGEVVWGEYPPCERSEWQARARVEVGS